MNLWPAAIAGAVVGLGLTLVVAGLVATRPDLRAALEHLAPRASEVELFGPGTGLGGPWARAGDRYLPRLVESLGLRRFAAELRVVGVAPEQLAARKVGYGLLGAVFPTLVVAPMAVVGIGLPLTVPLVASLASAAILFVLPDIDIRRRAQAAREDLRRAACLYLELVALQRAADAGTTEALNRAADIGDSPQFTAIRGALVHAELSGRSSWEGLRTLAEATDVIELGDLADIMAMSGQDGAAVYTTLRARAASLRTQLLTVTTAKANAASEHMVVPAALLGIAFMALIAYPALTRILFG
jgi:hypothetical protein